MERRQEARKAAEYALEKASSSSFWVSLLEGKWVGAKCMLAAMEHQLGDSSKGQDHAHQVVDKLAHESG